MSNSITGRCWKVDTQEALTTEPTHIMAIHLEANDTEDVMTLTDTAGVRIAEINTRSTTKDSMYQVFPYPGVFGKGVICSALSGSCKAIIYIY